MYNRHTFLVLKKNDVEARRIYVRFLLVLDLFGVYALRCARPTRKGAASKRWLLTPPRAAPPTRWRERSCPRPKVGWLRLRRLLLFFAFAALLFFFCHCVRVLTVSLNNSLAAIYF
jgi:hypothetical protein